MNFQHHEILISNFTNIQAVGKISTGYDNLFYISGILAVQSECPYEEFNNSILKKQSAFYLFLTYDSTLSKILLKLYDMWAFVCRHLMCILMYVWLKKDLVHVCVCAFSS